MWQWKLECVKIVEHNWKMSSAAVSSHSSSVGAGPLSLMSCVRESSPRQDFDAVDSEKIVTSKRRFWNPKKWFKRKHKVSDDALASGLGSGDGSSMEIGNEALRSRSTSELSVTDEQSRRRSAASIQQGLSVSHDSVFHSPHSGSDMELEAAQSSSSLSTGSHPHHIDHRLQTELTERLRLRRGRGDTSEDDEGLPHSPCNSPTTTEGLLDKTAIKDLPTKSHSTCSDGSFLSMGSSEMDEDSFGLHSRHSSKLSLHEKKTEEGEADLELGSNASVPLNHSAAHHRVAVRPKKTHGAPRRKRPAQLSSALPATPEVNEDSSIRSITPENFISKESVTEVYSRSSYTLTESQIKCSSLPPGIQPPDASNKLNRSKSNAGVEKAPKLEVSPVTEENSTEDKPDKSFFDRIFPRKSAKKKKLDEKKSKENENIQTKSTESTSSITVVSSAHTTNKRVESKPIAAPRTGPASRQRIQPIELPPASPELDYRKDIILPKPSPEKAISAGTSPLQMELENRFKLRQSTSPTSLQTPPQSPRSPISDFPQFAKDLPQFPKDLPKSPKDFRKSPNNCRKLSRELPKSPKFHIVSPEKSFEFSSKFEKQTRNESRRRVHIAGLTSLQQRVLSLNDDEFDGFKSLSDLPCEKSLNSTKITKSHSFKATNSNKINIDKDVDEEENRVIKAASLDSVKILDDFKENKYQSDCKFDFTSESKPQESNDLNDKSAEEIKRNFVNNLNDFGITISGPSHTAIVNITNNFTESKTTESSTTEQLKRTENLSKKECFASQKNKSPNQNEQIYTKDENEKHLNLNEKINIQSGKFDKHSDDFLNSEKHAGNIDKLVNEKILNSEKDFLAESAKESQVSITKVQVKKEVTQVTTGYVTLLNSDIPEFISKQLNKVDRPGSSNVVFSMNSPRIIEEMKKQPRPKTLDISASQSNNQVWPRKFSQDNLEIIEKDTEDNKKELENNNIDKSSPTTPTTPVTHRFKKNDSKCSSRKSSVASITPDPPKKYFKSRSVSLDSLKSSDVSEKSSSQDSLDKLEEKSPATLMDEPPVIMRRKSQMKKDDDQPELMKVFARRSLKLKDTESETISDTIVATLDTDNDNSIKLARDSDKENQESPLIERKISAKFEEKKRDEKYKIKDDDKKEPLNETKIVTSENDETETVSLRKTNGTSLPFPRSISLNPPASGRKLNDTIFRNQSIYIEKVDESKMKVANDVLNDDLITETKNFNQRKAEWEKRAQLAQKKNVP